MFDNIFAAIEKWMRELLSGMVESNLSTMFTAVNQQTSEIAAQVGQTPQGWNSSIFSMIRNISDSVVIPIAGIIITLILCYELISMLTERNNLHDVDTWMFFKYFVKMWIAVYLVSHTFDIAMAVFDIGQSVVNSSSGIIRGNTAIDISSLSMQMQAAMATMAIGELVTLALETLVVSWCLKILSVVITVIMYGRMIEIYLYTSLAPIPFATMSKQYKDAYAAAKRGQKAGTAASKQAAAATNTITEKAKAAVQEIVVQHKTLWVGIGVGILLVMVMLGAFSSCGAAIQGTGSTFVGTTYPSKDADMKGAEEDYLELEKELDKQIRQMESTHPGYDEYRYQLDEIGHDPYQLISHLTAVYEQFTRGQVKPVIKELFKQQYLLKVWETIEIRTRMETYTYQEEVEYEYKILNVLLKNKGFDTIARKNMNQKQTGRYDAYNLTYGNRPELFGAGSPTYSGGTTGSIGMGGGAGGSGGGFKYDIPSEALSDEKFARMIEEAEKYLGMPYVWGGSSPSTSFDCSGFVCWVINNCGNGWSVGRTTANGLRGKCSYVSPADAQPGDLIFFEKTYNTVGASHVGIYVGNGMMIHCGDPISYTSINSTYWQSHFLGFGRIN